MKRKNDQPRSIQHTKTKQKPSIERRDNLTHEDLTHHTHQLRIQTTPFLKKGTKFSQIQTENFGLILKSEFSEKNTDCRQRYS